MKYLFFLLLLFSCSDVTTHVSQVTPAKEKTDFKKEIENKIKTKPKIFLKFWSGMNDDEWIAVRSILNKEGVLKDDFYLTNNGRIHIDYIFEKSQLKGITLVSSPEDIYPVYQKKYHLPLLVKSRSLTNYYVENNPDYNPLTVVQTKNEVVVLPYFFTDNSNWMQRGQRIKLPVKNETPVFILPKDEFTIDNDTVVVEMRQEITEDPIPFYQYSLSNNKQIERYFSTKEGKKICSGLFGSEGCSAVMKNSKLRYVTKTENPTLYITYRSKTQYQVEVQKRLKLKNNVANQVNAKKSNHEKLQKRVYNDI